MTTQLPAQPKAITPAFIIGSIAFAVLGTLLFMASASLIQGGARIDYDATPWALRIHVATVIPALFLGGPILWMRKGTRQPKILGRLWAALMVTTAISSFWLQGLIGSIGPIHFFSIITLISIPRAIYFARKGDFVKHQRSMTGPYIGLLIAGLFSFLPDRMMGQIAFALL